jgi:hypothetical protein
MPFRNFYIFELLLKWDYVSDILQELFFWCKNPDQCCNKRPVKYFSARVCTFNIYGPLRIK